jgi:hypothetical protein
MKRSFYSIVAVLMVISLSSAEAFAASAAAAMLRSNGGVSVNGSPVNPVTTVFAGDRIETAPQAAASLTMNGSSLLLDQNSSLTFTGDEMSFYCGGGTVQASQGLSARFGRVAVKPAKGTARFQVQQSGEMLKVSAIDGSLTVSDGAKTIDLAAGNSTTLPNLGCGQMAKNTPQNITSGNANANPSPTSSPTQPATAPQSPSGWTRGMIIPPSAVLATSIAGFILVNQNPVSPSGP